MINHASFNLTKESGKLKFPGDAHQNRYKNFLDSIPEGSKVEIYISIIGDDKPSLSQLSRVHAMIRELALNLGYTFDEMKVVIKKHAGLFDGENVKSFADCTKDDLNLAIQSCIQIGDFNEIQLR